MSTRRNVRISPYHQLRPACVILGVLAVANGLLAVGAHEEPRRLLLPAVFTVLVLVCTAVWLTHERVLVDVQDHCIWFGPERVSFRDVEHIYCQRFASRTVGGGLQVRYELWLACRGADRLIAVRLTEGDAGRVQQRVARALGVPIRDAWRGSVSVSATVPGCG